MSKIPFSRRRFFKVLGTGSLVVAGAPLAAAPVNIPGQQQEKPETNIADAARVPRNENSLPGKYPGRVSRVNHPAAIVDNEIMEDQAYLMLEKAMLDLTGEKKLKKAWRQFVSPGERIGLKVNPVAGKTLTTSHAVTKSIIKQLEESGMERENIIIWDRRLMQLHETGYTEENYPGINIMGTEQQDKEGSYYGSDGKLYGEKMIDKDWYYWADVEGEYDEYTMPFMVNGGKYSYFTRIVTQELNKIINVPILKNAGATVTNAMKNLAFGSVSNTGRLHAQLWNETCAHVCAFAPVRDKVVLNIVDGLKGCFNGGPGANPQFFCNYNTMLVGTDPVAIDRIAHEIVVAKRIEEGIQKEDNPGASAFLDMAESLELGISRREMIEVNEINIG
ncbi:MAG TPA: DUF362 domain-containing protein [Bacteroidetes bacterium]|nr:DUF362 domain-containing protein [Bacteroidota bacterium]